MSIDLVARLRPAVGKTRAVLDILDALVAETTQEAGNLEYRVFASGTDGDSDRDSELIVREAYEDFSALQVHRSSPHYQSMVPKIMGLLRSPIEAHQLVPIEVPISSSRPN